MPKREYAELEPDEEEDFAERPDPVIKKQIADSKKGVKTPLTYDALQDRVKAVEEWKDDDHYRLSVLEGAVKTFSTDFAEIKELLKPVEFEKLKAKMAELEGLVQSRRYDALTAKLTELRRAYDGFSKLAEKYDALLAHVRDLDRLAKADEIVSARLEAAKALKIKPPDYEDLRSRVLAYEEKIVQLERQISDYEAIVRQPIDFDVMRTQLREYDFRLSALEKENARLAKALGKRTEAPSRKPENLGDIVSGNGKHPKPTKAKHEGNGAEAYDRAYSRLAKALGREPEKGEEIFKRVYSAAVGVNKEQAKAVVRMERLEDVWVLGAGHKKVPFDKRWFNRFAKAAEEIKAEKESADQ